MRKVLWRIIFIAITLVCHGAADESLYVFYPTTTRPQGIQTKLASTFTGIRVTVFGRYKDFAKRVETAPPSAVVTKPVVVDQIKGYTPVLRALRSGSDQSHYALIALDTLLRRDAVSADMTIGAIDVLGRNGMKSFMGGFFTATPKIKRVVKVEDLLSLLAFNMVQGIFLEDVFVGYIKSTSKMDFHITELTGPGAGILVLAVKEKSLSATFADLLKKNTSGTAELFEVDGWEYCD